MAQHVGSKTGLELRAPSKGMPGESLDVDVSLQLSREIKVRQVRVELVGKEVEYHSVGKGGTARGVDTFIIVRNVLQEECVLHEGIHKRWRTSIQVPAEAPPTCKGKITEVNWLMRGVLDIPRRRDVIEELPVAVLATSLDRTNKSVVDITFITNEEERILRERFQVLIQEPRCTVHTWKGPIKDS